MNTDLHSLENMGMEGIDDGEDRSFFVRALYDFHSTETSSLSFKKGTLIEVLTQLESGWWDGLLGNDVRGWFPSNYVERISDEEAEAEFQSQQDFADLTRDDDSNDFMNTRFNPTSEVHENGTDDFLTQQREEEALKNALQNNASKSVGAQYSGLGLGQDFNTLRRLMDGVGSNENDETDAFEQLAEATMISNASQAVPNAINGHSTIVNDARDERLGVIDARRRSRMSDQSSILGSLATSNGTTYSNISQTDISSMKTRSNAASFSDAEYARKVALSTAESSRNALDAQEKERNRAHTVSGPEGQQQDQQSLLQQLAGRPRAQTAHAGMTSSSSAASSGGSQTTGAFTPSRKNSKMFNNESDSFWIPKVNEEGEIYYFNTQTGQQSRDLPQGAESGYDNDLSSSEQLNSGDAQNIRRSGTPGNKRNTPSTMRRNRSHQSGPSNVTISSDASDSRPTSSSSLHTAATRQSKIINTIDKMPESNQVPFPWIVRTSDDERTFYFYNRQTHEISHDTEAVLTHSLTNHTNNEDQRTVRVSGRKLSDTTSSSSRFGRNSSGGLQQNYKRPGHHLRYRSADQADTFSYQESLSNDQAIVDLRTMIDKTGDAIAILASMASEEIGEDGLSQLDARALGENQNSLKDESRLSIAISNVVENICRLLRTAGALNISPIDLLNAAETVHMNQDYPNESEALHGFQHSISSLQGRSLNVHESSESDLFVTAASFNAIPTPPASLLPLGKKINATLSKLVLSARSVVEQSCLNAVERPSFTQAQLEKILSYRNRIKDDSMELARALGVFSNEIAQPSAFGRSNGYSTQRKQNAYLRSGKADSGIGLNVFGGGSAAGWRGNGFVLPSAKEAAALSAKAQMPETHLQDLTKEAKKAVSSGSIALRRKPTLALSREILEGTITTKFAHYAEVLSELRLLLIAKENEEQKKISAQNVIFTSTKVLRHFGALISWIEEIDLASGLDVDGPALDDTKALSSEGEDYQDLVITTRQTLHRFGNVKQAAFDACQMLLICVQDRTMNPFVLPEHLRTFSINEETIKLVDKLGFTAVQLQSLLAELLHLSETQLKFGFSSMGGRAKVHGIADVKMKMVEDKVVKVNQSLDGQSKMISTNNNLAAPVTPTVSSSASSSTAMAGPTSVMVSPTQVSDAKTNSVPSSSLKAMFQRARSTSVATGASATSNDSSRLAAGQEDVEGVRGSSRFRRDTVDGQSSINVPSAPGSSTGDHMGGDGSLKQAEEIPWFLQPDTPPEDIILNPNGQVKGATLSALMERLTMHNAFDSSFNSTFLMTYRSFTSTDELLDLLFARFRIQEPAGLTLDEHELWIEKKQRPIRFRVFNVLKSWLEGQFHENENEMHMKRVRDFALDEMAHSPAMAMPANLLLRIIERRSGTGEQMKITMVMPSSAPPPILPKNFRKIKFLDIDPLEMARQLTLMDSRLYNRIRPAECLGKAWSREDGASKAKGVRDVIGANNRVSGWVSEAILVQEDVKKRAAWVKQFVAIADRCFYLNNFSSMMAIYSGLNNASLNRLRRTWDAVNQRHLQLFDNMRAILAPTRNFTRYRETLRKLNPPCVPFLGVYLTDLTFIEDGNTDRLRTDDRLINFSKRQMTAEKIQEIMIYQSTPYNLTPVPGIQKFIEENLIDARTDDELFEQSLRLEPREREDEKIARLLQESGFL